MVAPQTRHAGARSRGASTSASACGAADGHRAVARSRHEFLFEARRARSLLISAPLGAPASLEASCTRRSHHTAPVVAPPNPQVGRPLAPAPTNRSRDALDRHDARVLARRPRARRRALVHARVRLDVDVDAAIAAAARPRGPPCVLRLARGGVGGGGASSPPLSFRRRRPRPGRRFAQVARMHAELNRMGVRAVDPENLRAVAASPSVALVDVRQSLEFSEWRVPPSINCPYAVPDPNVFRRAVGTAISIKGGLKVRNPSASSSSVAPPWTGRRRSCSSTSRAAT